MKRGEWGSGRIVAVKPSGGKDAGLAKSTHSTDPWREPELGALVAWNWAQP